MYSIIVTIVFAVRIYSKSSNLILMKTSALLQFTTVIDRGTASKQTR